MVICIDPDMREVVRTTPHRIENYSAYYKYSAIHYNEFYIPDGTLYVNFTDTKVPSGWNSYNISPNSPYWKIANPVVIKYCRVDKNG
jgi:hypothetical protein